MFQTLAAVCAQSLSISIGFTQAYSAILLPQLETEDSEQFRNLTDDQLSWIGKYIFYTSFQIIQLKNMNSKKYLEYGNFLYTSL